MRKFAIATIMLALVATPALAQRGGKTSRSEAQQRTDAEIDKDYQRVMQSTRDKGQAAPADPWGKVRPASTPTTSKR